MEDSKATASRAYLHAHGLERRPKGLQEDFLQVFEGFAPVYRADPGREGLTAAELAVAVAGGLEAEPDARSKDPLAAGLRAYVAVVAESLSTRKAAAHLNVTDARIRQRCIQRSLLGIRVGNTWKLPRFQFTDDGELPGWAQVCVALPETLSPVSLARWLAQPNSDLISGKNESPVSPLQWLVEGRPPEAVAALADELA